MHFGAYITLFKPEIQTVFFCGKTSITSCCNLRLVFIYGRQAKPGPFFVQLGPCCLTNVQLHSLRAYLADTFMKIWMVFRDNYKP